MKKKFKLSCCKSYATPRGRCYSCPNEEVIVNFDPDEEIFI